MSKNARPAATAATQTATPATTTDAAPVNYAQTLLTLSTALGTPTAAAVRAAFRGADPAWMLASGQAVASEVILRDGTDFVRSVRAIWETLSDAQRAAAKGYNPALDTVLVHELMALRDESQRYDTLAQGAGISIAERRQRAKDAYADGVIARQVYFQTLRDYLEAEHPTVAGLAPAMRAAQTAEVLARGLDAVADVLHRLRHGDAEHAASAELRADLDFAGLGDDAETALHAHAIAVRTSADLADARPKDIAAAQRALDVQDGRVLHVMGLVLRGFRRARRQHPTTLLPVLGDLGRVFNVTRNGGDDDEPEPTPAPAPTPA